jgi:transcriptional regulator NrdR family protein
MYVVKRDGEREPFNPEKLRRAVLGATHKRRVRAAQVERLVERVEAELGAEGSQVPSQRVGELVLEGLRELDYGAYLQFAGTLPDISTEIAASPSASSVRLEEDGSEFPAGPATRRGFDV